jgi:DNA repair ATPase RecN
MKRVAVLIVMIPLLLLSSSRTFGQSEEVEQLLLNVEKLAQLKQILNDLYKGYEIVSKGYNTISNISKGNFNLHKAFLDGLMEVSPAVKSYSKVQGIISKQVTIVKEYKSAFNRFKASRNFTSQELDYLGNVYQNLFNKSLKDLEALAMVLTAGDLRMTDDERLSSIDTIYKSTEEKLDFLIHFNNSASIIAVQRAKDTKDLEVSRRLYSINQ